jgi:hypothetical protein
MDLGDRYRDTLVLTIRGVGVDIPPYFIRGEYANASLASGRRPKSNQKAVKGMTVALMMKYIDHVSEYVSEPSLFIMDRLSSHTSKAVLTYLKSKKTADGTQKFIPILLKPKTAFLISPLDNAAIGLFKRKFYKYDRTTIELKELAAYRAWRDVSNAALRAFIKDCGIVGTENVDSLLTRFMKEVKGGIPEKNADVWSFYESWRYGAISVAGVPSPRGSPLAIPQQLENAELDGEYWCSYGRTLT